MDTLCAESEGPALSRLVVLRDAAARLHVVRDETVVDDSQSDDAVRRGKRPFGLVAIAHVAVEGDVALDPGPDLRRPDSFRALDPDSGAERRPVDLDRLRRVPCPGRRIGDDESDGVSDVPHRVPAEHRIRRQRHRRAVAVLDRSEAGHVAEMLHVLVGQDEEDARHGADRREVADAEGRVRVRAADEDRVRGSIRLVVVGVAPGAGDESGVFDAPHRLADAELHGTHAGLRWDVSKAVKARFRHRRQSRAGLRARRSARRSRPIP
jgi:hypothetical protein